MLLADIPEELYRPPAAAFHEADEYGVEVEDLEMSGRFIVARLVVEVIIPKPVQVA